jgi:hypothetical protein
MFWQKPNDNTQRKHNHDVAALNEPLLEPLPLPLLLVLVLVSMRLCGDRYAA